MPDIDLVNSYYSLKDYVDEPEEELGENRQVTIVLVEKSTGAIWTLKAFTQFLLGLIATQVTLSVTRKIIRISRRPLRTVTVHQ